MSERDALEAVFTIDVAPEDAWAAVTRPARDQVPGEPARYFLAGFEAVCSELEVDPGRMLRMRKEEEPCKGTEIVVVIEDAGGKSRVTVVQSGFPAAFRAALESFRFVWTMIHTDLALYMERGVSTKAHLFGGPPPRASLGLKANDAAAGLKVAAVEPGGFGARAGVAAGDLLVSLNGVRLTSGMQLIDLMRMAEPGMSAEAAWVRGREKMSASATL